MDKGNRKILGFLMAPIGCSLSFSLYIYISQYITLQRSGPVFDSGFFIDFLSTIPMVHSICFIPGLVMLVLIKYFKITSLHKCYLTGSLVGVIYIVIIGIFIIAFQNDLTSIITNLSYGYMIFGATMGFVWALTYGLIGLRN